MYSGFGLGVTFWDGNISPNFYLLVLRMCYGKKLGVFNELGLGCKGLFNAGLPYQF